MTQIRRLQDVVNQTFFPGALTTSGLVVRRRDVWLGCKMFWRCLKDVYVHWEITSIKLFCFLKIWGNFKSQRINKPHVGRFTLLVLYRELYGRRCRGNFPKRLKQHPHLFLLANLSINFQQTFVLMKTSWRCLSFSSPEDALKMSPSHLDQDEYIPTSFPEQF